MQDEPKVQCSTRTSAIARVPHLTTLTFILALAATPSAAAETSAIAGKWKTDDGTSIILIAPCTAGAATQCGWINRFLVPEKVGGARDDKNPDKAQRSRKLLGVAILTGLKADGMQWTGRGYSPKDGRNFNARVRIENGNLNLRGCVSIICRTVVWTRG